MNAGQSILDILRDMDTQNLNRSLMRHLSQPRVRPATAVLLLGLAFLLLATACGGGGEAETSHEEAHTTASETDTSDYDTSQTTETSSPEPVAAAEGELSAAAEEGRKLFIANCAQCHGRRADGTTQGPPLVHQIYEPGHHANASFVIAVTRGVRAHHWEFGNMPAVPGLSIDDIHQVICYVRELQVANGITDQVPSSTPC